MQTFIVLAAAAQTTYYEAKVASFGCNSIQEVRELLSLRSDPKAFPMALLTKQVEGQCVAIQQGTKVEGSIEDGTRRRLHRQRAAQGSYVIRSIGSLTWRPNSSRQS